MNKLLLSGCEAALSREAHLSGCKGRTHRFAPTACLLLLCSLTLAAQNGITISDFSTKAGSPTTVTFNVQWVPLQGKVWSDTAGVQLALGSTEHGAVYQLYNGSESLGSAATLTGTGSAATTQTWVFGSQTWSDRITAPAANGCAETKNVTNGYTSSQFIVLEGRYFYTWTCVYNNLDYLCDDGWRFPTRDDFNTPVQATTADELTAAWGLGGDAYGPNIQRSDLAQYWSSSLSTCGTSYGDALMYGSEPLGVYCRARFDADQVRCVK